MAELTRRGTLGALGGALLAGCLGGAESGGLVGTATEGPAGITASVASPPAAGTWPMAKRDAAATASAPAANGPSSLPLELDWSHSTGQSEMRTPVVTEGPLLALTGHPDASLAALDPATGEPTWAVTHDWLGHASPAVAGDRAFVPWGYYQTGEYVDALALDDGARAWRATLSDAAATDLVHVGDTLYGVLESGPTLLALSADSGATALRLPFSEPAFRIKRLAVADGTVFAAVSGMETDYPDVGFVVAIDPVAGEADWIHELAAPVVDLSVAEGTVYAVSGTGLTALAAGDGERRWADETFEGSVGAVCVSDGTVLAGAFKQVRAVDAASGEGRWEAGVGGSRALVVAGDTVYAVGRAPGESTRYGIAAIDVAEGQIRWRHGLAARPTSASVAAGRLYVGTDGGRLLAFG